MLISPSLSQELQELESQWLCSNLFQKLVLRTRRQLFQLSSTSQLRLKARALRQTLKASSWGRERRFGECKATRSVSSLLTMSTCPKKSSMGLNLLSSYWDSWLTWEDSMIDKALVGKKSRSLPLSVRLHLQVVAVSLWHHASWGTSRW